MCLSQLADHDAIAMCWSILLGLLAWLNSISVPENDGCDWDLNWFMLANILMWQAYVYFWRQFEHAREASPGRTDPFFPPADSHMARKLINRWTLVLVYLNSIVYLVLFVKGSVTCSIFRFQSRIIYQWIMMLITLGSFLTISSNMQDLKRLAASLKLIILKPLHAIRLRSKIKRAKGFLNTPDALKMYLQITDEVDGFEGNHQWKFPQNQYILLDLLDDDLGPVPPNEIDIYFWSHILVKEFRNQSYTWVQLAECPICNLGFKPHEGSLFLECCDGLVHWYCMQRHFAISGNCPSCSKDLISALRKAVSTLLDPEPQQQFEDPRLRQQLQEEAALAEA